MNGSSEDESNDEIDFDSVELIEDEQDEYLSKVSQKESDNERSESENDIKKRSRNSDSDSEYSSTEIDDF